MGLEPSILFKGCVWILGCSYHWSQNSLGHASYPKTPDPSYRHTRPSVHDTPISGPQNRWQLDTQNPTSKRIPRLLSLRHVNFFEGSIYQMFWSPWTHHKVEFHIDKTFDLFSWWFFFYPPYVGMTGTSFTACWLSSVSSGVNVLLFVLLVDDFFYGCLSWHSSPFFTTTIW